MATGSIAHHQDKVGGWFIHRHDANDGMLMDEVIAQL
jgi:hypothetical protein